jgi:hypothetical protein
MVIHRQRRGGDADEPMLLTSPESRLRLIAFCLRSLSSCSASSMSYKAAPRVVISLARCRDCFTSNALVDRWNSAGPVDSCHDVGFRVAVRATERAARDGGGGVERHADTSRLNLASGSAFEAACQTRPWSFRFASSR